MKNWMRSVWNRKVQRPKMKGDPQLYDLLAELNDWDGSILDWLHPLDDNQFLLTQWKSPEFRHYNGKEVGIFSPQYRAYYRLPGALPNGAGHVENRKYKLLLMNIFWKRGYHLLIDKKSDEMLGLSNAKDRNERFYRLEMRFHNYDPELINNIKLWVREYQQKRNSQIPENSERKEQFSKLMEKCSLYAEKHTD